MKKVRVNKKRLQIVTGKLVNATRIAPASKALLTPFFKAMYTEPSHQVLKSKFDLHQAMGDMEYLLQDLHRRPTHVSELVLMEPIAVGMIDASGSEGISGFWVSHLFPPTIFRII